MDQAEHRADEGNRQVEDDVSLRRRIAVGKERERPGGERHRQRRRQDREPRQLFPRLGEGESLASAAPPRDDADSADHGERRRCVERQPERRFFPETGRKHPAVDHQDKIHKRYQAGQRCALCNHYCLIIGNGRKLVNKIQKRIFASQSFFFNPLRRQPYPGPR
jgi:hypothetical protein